MEADSRLMNDHRTSTEGPLIGTLSETIRGESHIEKIQKAVKRFTCRNGRRPRVLACYIGSDGPVKILGHLASIFAQWGFDVDIGPVRQSVQPAAMMAIENDVHLVCLVCAYDHYPATAYELSNALIQMDGGHILVAVLGDIPDELRFKNEADRRNFVNFNPHTDDEVVAFLEKLG
jgi:methylmalonyl-CoA mutase cobalamin-binding domain/chain